MLPLPPPPIPEVLATVVVVALLGAVPHALRRPLEERSAPRTRDRRLPVALPLAEVGIPARTTPSLPALHHPIHRPATRTDSSDPMVLTAHVLRLRDLLKMPWLTASAVIAEVVENHSFHQRVPRQYPCEPMRAAGPPSISLSAANCEFRGDDPVSGLVHCSGPFKATSFRAYRAFQKPFAVALGIDRFKRDGIHMSDCNGMILAAVAAIRAQEQA